MVAPNASKSRRRNAPSPAPKRKEGCPSSPPVSCQRFDSACALAGAAKIRLRPRSRSPEMPLRHPDASACGAKRPHRVAPRAALSPSPHGGRWSVGRCASSPPTASVAAGCLRPTATDLQQLSCSLHQRSCRQHPARRQVSRRQMIEARPFGMHLLAAGTGIRKTLSTSPFENPTNTRAGLSVIRYTEIS